MRKGFTLVELLVVISIIALIASLLLPAVFSARESARRLQCTNNLKQLAIGAISHQKRFEFFPSGGWSWHTVGSPDCGYGKMQPGGWLYNVLPFIEEGALHDKGIGLTGSEFKTAIEEVCATPIRLFNCPTRRKAEAVSFWGGNANSFYKSGNSYVKQPVGTELVGRADYAGNAGSGANIECNGADYGVNAFTWDQATWNKNDSGLGNHPDPAVLSTKAWIDNPGGNAGDQCYNGVIFFRSEITLADITDGSSNTYLIGEKMNNTTRYFNNIQSDSGGADNESCFIGHDIDTLRWCYYGNDANKLQKVKPKRDIAGEEVWCFGSAHAVSFSMAFCDGSVHSIQYDIEPRVHGFLGSRRDTHMIPHSEKWK